METHYVYILQSQATGRFYVGHTENLEERIKRHHKGRAHSTRSQGPFEVVYVEKFRSRSEAARREAQIKARKSRPYIERLSVMGSS